jgi:hypothetical protein
VGDKVGKAVGVVSGQNEASQMARIVNGRENDAVIARCKLPVSKLTQLQSETTSEKTQSFTRNCDRVSPPVPKTAFMFKKKTQ